MEMNLEITNLADTKKKIPKDEDASASTNILRFTLLLLHLFHICLLYILKDCFDLASVYCHEL